MEFCPQSVSQNVVFLVTTFPLTKYKRTGAGQKSTMHSVYKREKRPELQIVVLGKVDPQPYVPVGV
jgi:hypothetical protein